MCRAARWMEANMFPRPEVASEMANFVRARLYTDGDGDPYEHQRKMQQGTSERSRCRFMPL